MFDLKKELRAIVRRYRRDKKAVQYIREEAARILKLIEEEEKRDAREDLQNAKS